MPTEFRFNCPLRNGLHARPASLLAEVVRQFTSEVTLTREAAGAPPAVDARSVLSVVGLDVRHGDPCLVVAGGADAAAAVAAVREFVETRLGSADDAAELAPGAAGSPGSRLPVTLRRLGVSHTPGKAVCGGIGIGVAVIANGLALPEEAKLARPASLIEELDAARRAIASVRQDLQRRAAEAPSPTERDLLRAHGEMADDPALWIEIERGVRNGATAAQAVAAAAERFIARLRAAESAYIRDRVVDVQDIGMQLIDRLMGGRIDAMRIDLTRDSVVFTDILTPGQLLRMERRFLRGLVLGAVGETAHTVILARTMGIPSLIDAADACAHARPGEDAIVDGDGGFVLTPVTPAASRYYDIERRTRQRRLDLLGRTAKDPAHTPDGARLEIGVNASTAEDVSAAVRQCADGVGLFRTEFLFLERDSAPTEDEQFAVCANAVAAAAGRPIIFRTFDIGGDKPAPYLRIPHEENPFLGCRGLRLYERYTGLLRMQLRAVLRASAGAPPGTVQVMAPMVATPAEAAWFRARVTDVRSELRSEGVATNTATPVGVMIEVPAAAMVIDQLCTHVDFFSVGTNDLCQYWMAADRGNRAVSPLCNPLQPTFLRLLRSIVRSARVGGKWIGLCGEMGGRTINLPLMLGLGLDEVSVAPGQVLSLKAAVAAADAARCRSLLDAACDCHDPSDVETLLKGSAWRSAAASSTPIIDRGLIEVAGESSTKEEAIKEAVDLLYVAGRTERPRAVEEAVWAREETYSTGLGFGFAVPHCKTDAVASPALAVIKLRAPVEWGSMDGQPVRMVMLLAVPAGDTEGAHMKVFAKLARRLMHEQFRQRVLDANDIESVVECLKEELAIE